MNVGIEYIFFRTTNALEVFIELDINNSNNSTSFTHIYIIYTLNHYDFTKKLSKNNNEHSF